MINFTLQNHKPLREIVYEELKRQIMVGEIAPGTRMMEVELAEEMGVSRTPVREAIRKLEKEGLVTIEPRRGAYASDISAKDMVDILEVRQDLEGMQVMQVLGENMAFFINCKNVAVKMGIEMPEPKNFVFTNFIH